VEATGTGYSGLSRYYDLEARANMESGFWQGVPDATNIPGSESTQFYTNVLPGNSETFRVKARLQ
jgi:hypothetical protein